MSDHEAGRRERAPGRRLVGVLFVAAALGCSGIDDVRLIDPTAPSADAEDGGADAGGSGGAGGTGPSAGAGATGGASGSGSMAGMGATGGMGGGAGTSGLQECIPNPNEQDEVCPEICPETCNNEDDDCDLRIDEAEAAGDCDFPNTESTCRRGECLVISCQNGYRDCDSDGSNGCEVPEDDVANCGLCGVVCDLPNAIEACVDGGCVAIGCDDGYGDCSGGLGCETSTKTLEHCGDCGMPCAGLDNAIPTCNGGICEPEECVGNFGDCNTVPSDGCELELVTLEHCGGCNTPCDLGGSAEDCGSGVCLSAGCEVGFADCDMDPSNACDFLGTGVDCGACGARCDDGLPNVMSGTCTDMSCDLVCDAGFGDCSGGSADGCETSLDSVQNCADCGTPCTLAHAVGDCSTGSCLIGQCNDGWGDCANGATDGCEQRLDTLVHCGGCNVPCAKFSCAGGVCTDIVCVDPNADCNGDGLDCEIDTDTNLSHCGACNSPCAFTTGTPHAALGCTGGICEAICDLDHDDCDANYRNGCEPLATLQNCGSCGTTCAIAHAVPTCASGSCEVASCDLDWDDCNADGLTCETDLSKTNNCGACFNQCNLLNAVEACTGAAGAKTCTISICDASYFRDCDMMHATGCEVDTRSNAQHCGACGTNCAAHPNVSSATCSASACNYTCANGFGNCTGALGCETAVNTKQNCGACGFDCDVQLANTSATQCGAGPACQIVTCDSGYANCDMSHATGCETSIFTVTNCGGCASTGSNQPCTGLSNVMTSSCGAGMCVIDACNAGYASCDANVQNGCESQLAVDTQDCGACGNDCEAKLNVATAHCTGGACVVDTCDAPYADCGGAPDCETRIDTTTNCGSCGANCGVLLPNTTATQCIGGTTCEVVTCAAGYDDCTAGAGCETSIFTVTNCGGCSSTGNNEPCTGLPHVTASSCGAGTCVIDACDANWEDCDGVAANGCELDQTTQVCCNPLLDADSDGVDDCADECPSDAVKAVAGDCGCPSAPVAGGTLCYDGLCEANTQCDGLGSCGSPSACAPTGTCTFSTYATSASSGYWTCTNAVLRATAATNCAAAVGGRLVRIDDVVENNFVFSRIASDSWMGGSDATVEGTWRWSDGAQFWSGGSGGSPLLYAHWSSGEPNNSGDQDCLQMYDATGFWDDFGCAAGNRAYVCEIPADQCPNDPKLLPGVCGCAVADVDTDGDGFEDCLETCDADPLKQDPGACGCGNLETDTDGDASPDCVDGCDYNANYTGACQPKRKKITIDGNQVPDLVTFAASNYTHALYAYDNAVVLDCGGTHGYDSGTNTFSGTWCGVFPQTSLSVTQTTAGGSTVDILRFASLSIAAGTTLRLTGGTEPVILAVEGNATIAGIIDAGSTSTSVGAGANYACTPAPSAGAGGKGGGNCTGESGGGGGGGFGTAGGQGGQGDNATGVRGAAGQARGSGALSPLLGGCPGGDGGGGANVGFAGNGGGAVQLSVRGNLTVSGTVRANGEAGAIPVGCNEGGGGGGGSGGGVLIEAMGTLTTAGSTITANGAGGAAGEDGTDGNGGGGAGGAGSTSSASAGSNGSDHGTEGGGGGGGGYGRVLTRQTPSGTPPTDFPVLVRITDANIAFSAASDGRDIYFKDDVGTTLSFERMSYASGTLVAWVKMSLTGLNQDFYVYYGDGDRTEKSTPSAVWNNGYDAAWHMEAIGATLPDSSPANRVLNREAAQSGTWPTNATGAVGGGLNFDGSTCCTAGDYLYAAPVTSIDGGTFSVSVWVKRDTNNTYDYILNQGTTGANDQAFHFGQVSSGGGGFRFAFYGDDLNVGTFQTVGTWVYWVGTYNNATNLQTLYQDGVSVGSRTATADLNTTGNFEIGRQAFTFADYFDGTIDEVRVSSVVRSASWILTEYNNQRSGSTFLSFGTEESL